MLLVTDRKTMKVGLERGRQNGKKKEEEEDEESDVKNFLPDRPKHGYHCK